MYIALDVSVSGWIVERKSSTLKPSTGMILHAWHTDYGCMNHSGSAISWEAQQ